MRKVALLMAIILVFSTPLSVSATPRMLTIDPAMDFDRGTATCEVAVVGNNISELIQVTMTLKYGSTVVDSWYSEGYGYVYMLEYADAVKGRTYDLVVAVVFNGEAQTPVSIRGTC